MKKERTSRSYKMEITRLENLLWECYANLQDLYGFDGDDFLIGHEERLSFSQARDKGLKLKLEIRKVLE